MLAKIKDTTKASDDEIGRNLMGLARARPDVFGERPSSVHPWSGSVHPQSARKATLHASLPQRNMYSISSRTWTWCQLQSMWSLLFAKRQGVVLAGSTQDELSSIVEASIKESKISGNDRDVAWDGATMGGQDLQNQVRPGSLLPVLRLLPSCLS